MATIYDGNSNCLECGRLVAPSSGLYGACPNNTFCCRKCLRSYYDSQPGLWEKEEEYERWEAEQFEIHQKEIEEENLRINEENKKRIEEESIRLKEEHLKRIQNRNSHIGLFFVLLVLTYLIGSIWCWIAFIIYGMILINKWINS